MAVEQHPVPRGPAEEPAGRHAQGFARQVPQSDVDAGQGRLQHRPPAPEGAAEDVLPEVFDPGGILAHQEGLEVLQGLDHRARAAAERGLANAVQPLVGDDLDVDERAHGKHFHVADFHGCSSLSAGRAA